MDFDSFEVGQPKSARSSSACATATLRVDGAWSRRLWFRV